MQNTSNINKHSDKYLSKSMKHSDKTIAKRIERLE